MPDLPPSICAARIASHLANAGAAPGMGSYTRLAVADQALREVYAMGFRLVRTTVLDDMDRERDELLDELARVTAQRDRLLEEQVGRTVTGADAPWPLDVALAEAPNPPPAPPPPAPTWELVEKGGRVEPRPGSLADRLRRRRARETTGG